MEFKLVNVPDPKLNPAGPYSKFHAVSVPPAVHDKSAELLVILVAINPLGSGQNGIASIVISSTNK